MRVNGTSERPRLCVYRSNGHIYAQVIDDRSGRTIASASTVDKETRKDIKGGAHILREALAGNLADELRLAIAPFFVADPAAPRFALPAPYPQTSANPMTLLSLRQVGEVAVHRYRLSPG